MVGPRLTLAEREEIMAGLAGKEPVRLIAVRLGRAPSTVSREVRRNLSPPRRYRALPAHIQAMGRARRCRPRKLAPGTPVRAQVVRLLGEQCSPGQIAGRLKRDYPGQPELQVSHETIYQALFVQARPACAPRSRPPSGAARPGPGGRGWAARAASPATPE